MARATIVLIIAGCTILGAGAGPAPAQTPRTATAPPCTAAGVELKFICGARNPEDLVQVPGSDWIIGSGMAVADQPGSGGLILVDPKAHTAARLVFAAARPAATFAACPGPLQASSFSAHGLNILPQGRGKARLFVVGHGEREAIEVFEVTTSAKAPPRLNWIGCVLAPKGGQMNSVVGLPDGRIIATEFFAAPLTMQDALRGRNTGAVFVSNAGGAFQKLAGTDLPGPNGIEVTPDHKQLFVAVTGTSSVMRYDLADTARPPMAIKTDFRTDNLRWGTGGKLLLAGPGPDPNCKPAPGVRCPLAPAVGALDPATMKLSMVYRGPAEPGFSGLSSALIVGKTLWLGSYMADRVAYLGL
jgi:hypothetical protein